MSTRTWSAINPDDPPRQCVICGDFTGRYATVRDLLDLGPTYKQLDFWCRRQYLKACDQDPGTGSDRLFPASQVTMAAHLITLVSAGVPPAQAYHAIRNGGQLAPGVRVVVDAA